MGKDGGGGGGDPGGGGSWDSGAGGGDGGGDGGGGGGPGGGWGWGAGGGGDGGGSTDSSAGSSDTSTGSADTGAGPDTSGGAPSDPSAGGPSDLGGPGSGAPSDTGGPSADTGAPGGTGGGGGGGLGGAGTGAGGTGDGTGGPADTGTPGGDTQAGDLTARDVAAQYGVTDLNQLQSGDVTGPGPDGGQSQGPDFAGPGPAALGPAGAPGAAPTGGGGYGDPLAASDPSAALSVAAPGDPLGPQGAYGGDPFSVQGAGNVQPTVDASRGSMLGPDTQRLADASAREDAANEDLLGPQYGGPGTQLPSGEFRDAPTPGPVMAPGTEQADTLAGTQYAEVGQGDVPLVTAQKDQEQAPGPVPGGVGSTQSLVPETPTRQVDPFDVGTYNPQVGQVLSNPALGKYNPDAFVNYDAYNPPTGGFTSYPPGALATGGDPNLTAPEGSGLAPAPPGPDMNRLFFQSAPDAPSYQLSGSLQYDPSAYTAPTPAEQVQTRIPADFGAGSGGLVPSIQGTPTIPGDTRPSDVVKPSPSFDFGNVSPTAPPNFFSGGTPVPTVRTGPDGTLLAPADAGPGVPLPRSDPRGPAITAPPDTGPGAPGTQPEAPSTPGLPPDTSRPPASFEPTPGPLPESPTAPLPPFGDEIVRGQFEGGPSPSQRGLPPPPQLVNAMMANASPAVQQAAGSLSPAQQTQVTQYAFGLINQYRQILLSQGGVADPSSPVWQQQILPQIQQQTQQYVMQLTGSANPQAVQQIIASAA